MKTISCIGSTLISFALSCLICQGADPKSPDNDQLVVLVDGTVASLVITPAIKQYAPETQFQAAA